ncbi:hypothetical protein FRB99_006541 [Tulasnella sp. 403]|nr:hypothetical protein FRB99_006541 [Tulasnella sp. 403]
MAKWAHLPKDHKELNIGRGAVAFFLLFNILFSFTYTPVQALYPVEVLRTTTRAKRMAVYTICTSAITFINLYASPIALERIGYNHVFFFAAAAWDTCEAVLWYFLCVETVGYTLEELEDIFSASNPVAASKKKTTTA